MAGHHLYWFNRISRMHQLNPQHPQNLVNPLGNLLLFTHDTIHIYLPCHEATNRDIGPESLVNGSGYVRLYFHIHDGSLNDIIGHFPHHNICSLLSTKRMQSTHFFHVRRSIRQQGGHRWHIIFYEYCIMVLSYISFSMSMRQLTNSLCLLFAYYTNLLCAFICFHGCNCKSRTFLDQWICIHGWTSVLNAIYLVYLGIWLMVIHSKDSLFNLLIHTKCLQYWNMMKQAFVFLNELKVLNG